MKLEGVPGSADVRHLLWVREQLVTGVGNKSTRGNFGLLRRVVPIVRDGGRPTRSRALHRHHRLRPLARLPRLPVPHRRAGLRPERSVGRHRPPPKVTPRADVVVVRPEGGLFFANADAVRQKLTALVTPTTNAVIVDAQSVPALDVTAAEMLTALHQELEDRGVQMLIARDVGQVRDVLDHSDAANLSAYLHPTVRDALAKVDDEQPPPSDRR